MIQMNFPNSLKRLAAMHPQTPAGKRVKSWIAGLALLVATSLLAADPFEDIIRKTEPLTPSEEQKTFHLPPGFEIELVASEPEIGKPMNMAFDARGRLWITQSREYPFPVLPVEKPGRDKILVLEDFDPKGRAQKVSTFAEGLNIPIGLYPYKNGVIAFSIPKVHFLQDTDGDGKADKDDILLDGFGYQKDTHGLTSNFRRGFDGWIYADHGFNNDSTVVARDGSSITVNSGNTYRFRADGAHIEQFTHGQVNPFGLMFDPLGDLWSSDCHSSPTYLLVRGGYYPSFGKPHDGLGFAPNICTHQHGSTAIAGMIFYAAKDFPAEFQDNTFIGNVMTCKINRDSYIEHGSTRIAKEEPDFLTCDDPWFRPVDLQLGPDGAIYVADFYNRIIGHYEVPLTHPGRDRERGRIWRIKYVGPAGNPNRAGSSALDLSKAPVEKIIAELGHPNITRRMLAMNYLADESGRGAITPLQNSLLAPTNSFQKVHTLWALHRLGAHLPADAATDPDRLVRVHAMRILAETRDDQSSAPARLARAALPDSDPYVRRAAADTLGQHPEFQNIRPLLEALEKAEPLDTQFIYVLRMALRNQLQNETIMTKVLKTDWSAREIAKLADVAVAVNSGDAAVFLLNNQTRLAANADLSTRALQHAARFAPTDALDTLAHLVAKSPALSLDFQLSLFQSVQKGFAQRGAELTPVIREWGSDLAERLLASAADSAETWINHPMESATDPANPWFLQKRVSSDGDKNSMFLCSLPPGGESLTGILRSSEFTIPAELKFFLAGHDGPPSQPPRKKNLIRLVSAASHEILAESFPPRNDIARSFVWNLQSHSGKRGFIEVIDGDTGSAYAWLAVGRFQPEVVPLPAVSPSAIAGRIQIAADIAAALHLGRLAPKLAVFLDAKRADPSVRAALVKPLLTLDAATYLPVSAAILRDPNESPAVQETVALALAGLNSPAAAGIVAEALRLSSQRLQTKIAAALAGTPAGAETLLERIAAGQASPRLLQEKSVLEKLKASRPASLTERINTLTRGLAPADEARQKLIDARRDAFNPVQADAIVGARIFENSCQACHQIGGKGAVVGPQLDGVGGRGLDRLCEDILDPNRNVDTAFRYSTITLKDDSVLTGLLRREEGQVLVIADATGKEISVPKNQIKERVVSENSLMPDNFSEAISPQDFNHLLAFLLSKKK